MAKTILIVDASAAMRLMACTALRAAGYATMEASNGQDALNRLKAHKADLIVSEVDMPMVGGLAFATALKMLPQYCFTPVVLLTADPVQAATQKASTAGAKAWVVKPFQPVQLLLAVARLVKP